MAEAVQTASESLPAAAARFAKSSIGSKALMAITGLAMWGFLITHLAGNLLVYLGPKAVNDYSRMLHTVPELLWLIRSALIVSIVVHFGVAIRTTMANRRARPVPYAYANNAPASLASKTMVWSGLFALAFLAYHLLHFTIRSISPQNVTTLADGSIDVYRMLVLGFQQPLVSLFYVLAQIALAGHLSHGVYSQFQHLGLWGPKWSPWLKNASVIIGYGMSALFISIPVAVVAGWVHL